MVRVTFLNSLVTLMFALKLVTIIARFIVSTVGTALCSYVKVQDLASHLIACYYRRSASVTDKASDINYKVNTG